MTGQKAPAKMLVKPLIEKAAEQVASTRAAIKVAVETVMLLCRSTVTVGVSRNGEGCPWRNGPLALLSPVAPLPFGIGRVGRS
jgi:hypothetical protein